MGLKQPGIETQFESPTVERFLQFLINKPYADFLLTQNKGDYT
jgi:hypothetical protein